MSIVGIGLVKGTVEDLASSVLAMIHETAHANARHVAAICGDRSLSYQDLVMVAAANAERLLTHGVMAGDRVLCALPAGLELPVAWLATMTRGAVIIPIDPKWPIGRLRAVIDAADARLAIVHEDNPGLRQLGLELLQVRIDAPATTVMALTERAPSDLMYGFFTSGS